MKKRDEREVDRHPAFGLLSVTHIQGWETLFGSEATHQHFISVKLHRAYAERDLSDDRYYDDGAVTEVFLSYAQWAQFVSSVGMGGGVPCTIHYIVGEGTIAHVPKPKGKVDKFSKEMREHLDLVLKEIDELQAQANEAASRPSIRKSDVAALQKRIGMLRQQLINNVEFVFSQFQESVESTLSDAKQNFDAYVQRRVQSLGLQSEEVGQFMLGGGREDSSS